MSEIIINSLYIVGFYQVFSPGNVLHRLLPKEMPDWFMMPTFTCVPCMASVHGLIFAFLIGMDLHLIPLHIICVCGLNTVITQLCDL